MLSISNFEIWILVRVNLHMITEIFNNLLEFFLVVRHAFRQFIDPLLKLEFLKKWFCYYSIYIRTFRNGQSVFCSILIHLVSSQSSLNLPWNTLPEDIFSSVLDRLAVDDSLMKRSVPFVNLLSTICYLKSKLFVNRY